MKPRYIFWGMLFISFGLLILFNNIIDIELDWSVFWKLWPAVLILWGIALIVKNDILKNILTALTAFVLALSVFSFFDSGFNFFSRHILNHDTIIEIDEDGDAVNEDFFEPFDGKIKHASLNFDAGAGAFHIDDTTNGLISAVTRSAGRNYSLSRNDDGDRADIYFKMKKTHFRVVEGKVKNKVELKLNPEPVWDLDFDLGAAAVNFDLSEYKTENIKIDIGAASVKVRLGEKIEKINMDIDAGASYIEIAVPESSGCEVRNHSFLSKKDFDDFENIDRGLYRTNNFEKSPNKIYINLDSGISSLKVIRYLTSSDNAGWEY